MVTMEKTILSSTQLELSKYKSWIIATRPKTLLAAIVPVVVGSALAINKGRFILVFSVIALICSVLIQVGTNFTNDLYDYLKGADKEDRKGPIRVLAAGLISVKEMKVGVAFIFSVAFILGMILVYEAGPVIFVIGILSIIAGIAYTAGPYPLAYNGLGDLFVFMFFGIAGTTGTYFIQVKDFSTVSFLTSIPVGALITDILVVNNYRDIEEDRSAGKRTLAVIFGKEFTRFQFIFLILTSFAVPAILFFFFNFKYWIFLPYLTFPIAYKLIIMLHTLEGQHLNKTLELTAKLSALYGFLFAAGLTL
jgi:1,4-dihydroxy-2-naphthoate polyprenyltransferase